MLLLNSNLPWPARVAHDGDLLFFGDAAARRCGSAALRFDDVVRNATVIPAVLSSAPRPRAQASELLFSAFPNVICSHGQERRSSARWEAVINASAAPHWETLVGQWGAARDVIAACVFAAINVSAAGGGAPRLVLLCPAFVVAETHRYGGHSALRLYVSLAAINISAAGGGTPRLRGNGTAATSSYRAIASQRARRLPGSARASSSKPP